MDRYFEELELAMGNEHIFLSRDFSADMLCERLGMTKKNADLIFESRFGVGVKEVIMAYVTAYYNRMLMDID